MQKMRERNYSWTSFVESINAYSKAFGDVEPSGIEIDGVEIGGVERDGVPRGGG